MPFYNRRFFLSLRFAQKSAAKVVPLIIELFQPRSVVDVGCGIGVWLNEFCKLGIEDYLGIDGPWVDPDLLQIPEDKFKRCDLTRRIMLDRKFDLALSLEVGEHLPRESAETLVESLTRLSDVVIFSAAIPNQGGTHHVNEQWPDYWKALFERRDFRPIDIIRRLVWNDPEVLDFYSQNIISYVKQSNDGLFRTLLAKEQEAKPPINVINPRLWEAHTDPRLVSPKFIAKSIPFAVKNTISWILSNIKGK